MLFQSMFPICFRALLFSNPPELVGSMSASQAAFHNRSSHLEHSFMENNFPLLLLQEELIFSSLRKNGHLILVNCLREACPGTVWLSN